MCSQEESGGTFSHSWCAQMLPDLYVEGLHDNILLVLPFVISVRPKKKKNIQQKFPTIVTIFYFITVVL